MPPLQGHERFSFITVGDDGGGVPEHPYWARRPVGDATKQPAVSRPGAGYASQIDLCPNGFAVAGSGEPQSRLLGPGSRGREYGSAAVQLAARAGAGEDVPREKPVGSGEPLDSVEGTAGLRRADPAEPGLRRIRHGRGFRYLDEDGEPVRDRRRLERIRSLVLPPAWDQVWICSDPGGHLQAVGTDSAGRRQYRYHDRWRIERDRAKHDRVLDFAARLSRVRAQVSTGLADRGLTRERVFSAVVRLLDLGFFRVGGESYAAENETYGVATLLRSHVSCSRTRGQLVFTYPAKGGAERIQRLTDPALCAVVGALRGRSDPSPELLAYWERPHWRGIRAEAINDHLREVFRLEVTAKDFRTWHATVLAAVGLAACADVRGDQARRRAVNHAMSEVARYLGNTPAVARQSYVDPRVIDHFEAGRTIAAALTGLGEVTDPGLPATHGRVERAVRRLLRD